MPGPSNIQPPIIDLGGGLRAFTAVCRGCGKMILWARTKEGKAIPLDPRAYVVRVREYEARDDGQVMSITVEGQPEEFAERAYVSHFATCSRAKDFSGKGAS